MNYKFHIYNDNKIKICCQKAQHGNKEREICPADLEFKSEHVYFLKAQKNHDFTHLITSIKKNT